VSAAAWVFLGALVVVSLLLMVAVGANADLAAENRRLRRGLARLHPAGRSVSGGAA